MQLFNSFLLGNNNIFIRNDIDFLKTDFVWNMYHD